MSEGMRNSRMKTFDEIEIELLAACAEAQRRGMRVVRNAFGDGKEACCPLTAYYMSKNDWSPPPLFIAGEAVVEECAALFGRTEIEIENIYRGVDGDPPCDDGDYDVSVSAVQANGLGHRLARALNL
jgi:hypothetical protein